MTFQGQSSLPPLPIPELEHTLRVLERSLLPLTGGKLPQDIVDLVADFSRPNGGLGPILQRRLVDYASIQGGNWLDAWWFKYAYHTWREPLLIHSNWYMLLRHDSLATRALSLRSASTAGATGFTHPQLVRAATLTHGCLEYAESIDQGSLPAERTRKGPICMAQYRNIFGVTRRPVPGCDVLVHASAEQRAHPTIVVFLRNQAFIVDLFRDGKRLNATGIYHALCDVVRMATRGTALPEPVSLFTADHRDHWAENRIRLVSLADGNGESLRAIEHALLAVCLDEEDLPVDDQTWVRNTFHGPNNRWFDKGFSLIIDRTARAGVNGEHSPCDALIPALAASYAVNIPEDAELAGLLSAEDADYLSAPLFLTQSPAWGITPLAFTLDAGLTTELRQGVWGRVEANVGNSDTNLLVFEEYGTQWIKETAKVSPDAYFQMALQLAYYRLHGKSVGTYETAATRSFLHGRTECIRTLSQESAGFTRAVCEGREPAATLYARLVAASKAHSGFTRMASLGEGCDRHLMGLKLCLQPGESHPLLSHPLVSESSRWVLSTSGLFANAADTLSGTGFGAATGDGYGVNYTSSAATFRMGIESKREEAATSSQAFADTCVWALREMRRVCEEGREAGSKM